MWSNRAAEYRSLSICPRISIRLHIGATRMALMPHENLIVWES